jgi:hypothetical protein
MGLESDRFQRVHEHYLVIAALMFLIYMYARVLAKVLYFSYRNDLGLASSTFSSQFIP